MGGLHAHLIEFLAEALEFFVAALYLTSECLGWREGFVAANERGDYVLELMVFAEVTQRSLAGHGFQTAHAAGDATFAKDFDEADLAGCLGMRTAAEFGGEVTDLDDADLVAVLLAEERHGFVFVDGYVDGHVFDHFDAVVLQDFTIGEIFDVLEFFIFDAGKVG